MADGADRGHAAVLDVEIDLLRPLLAGVGTGDRRELCKQAREMAEEIELRRSRWKWPEVNDEPA